MVKNEALEKFCVNENALLLFTVESVLRIFLSRFTIDQIYYSLLNIIKYLLKEAEELKK